MLGLRVLSCSLLLAGGAAPQAPGSSAIEASFKPGETCAWVFESAGKRIGQQSSRFVGPETLDGRRSEHFQGSLRLELPGIGATQLSLADLWTDGDGHPLRYVQEFLVGTAYSRVEIQCAGKSSNARVAQGSSVREIPLDVEPAAFLLANNFISQLELYLVLQAHGQEAKARFLSATTLQGFDYSIREQGGFYQDSLGERLRMSEGRLAEVDIPAAKLRITRSQ